jgi:hypothetical protein
MGARTRHIQFTCNKGRRDYLVKKMHDKIGCVVARAAHKGLKRAALRVSKDLRIGDVFHLHDRAAQKAIKPDSV